jgi:hypothetical protein
MSEENELPSNMQSLIEHVGIWHPEDTSEEFPSDEIALIYGRRDQGLCMLCESPLGEDSIFCINAMGIQLMFCSPMCMQDMSTMQWLMEMYDDIVDKVKFRNRDVPERDEPGGDPTDPREE